MIYLSMIIDYLRQLTIHCEENHDSIIRPLSRCFKKENKCMEENTTTICINTYDCII